MSAAGKIKEAEEEWKNGLKEMKTGLFKWSPDYLAAERHFSKAARLFKSAVMNDRALEAWKMAADCHVGLHNLKGAATVLDSAARELSLVKDESMKIECSKLLASAGSYLLQAGEIPRAADLQLRAVKLIESQDRALAVKLLDDICSMFEGDSSKDVYAVEPLRKAFQAHIEMSNHASAIRVSDQLWKVWTRLDQKHNLFKLILSRVILLLASGDPVEAQAEYDRHLNLDTFASSNEAESCEDLLVAYGNVDSLSLKDITNRPVFNFLENCVTRIARQLPTLVETGDSIKSSAGESASKGVTRSSAVKNTIDLGDGMKATVLGGGFVDTSDSAFDRQSSKIAARDATQRDDRAALFARPSASVSRVAAAEEDDDEIPMAKKPIESVKKVVSSSSAPVAEEEDYEAAFAEMRDGGDKDETISQENPTVLSAPPQTEVEGLDDLL